MRRLLETALVIGSLYLAGAASAAPAPQPSPSASAAPTPAADASPAQPTPTPKASPTPVPRPYTPPPTVSPGTASPWGIPPQLRPKNARKTLWYLQTAGSQSSISFSPAVEARGVTYSQLEPLRSDRQSLATRVVTPIGGSLTDAVSSNSFVLARGGAATDNLFLGVAFPLSEKETLSFDALTYMRSGNALIARSFGVTLPYGHFVERSSDPAYEMPTFSPQFHRVTYVKEGPKHKLRTVFGDYTPIMWSPAEGPALRNYIDLSHLTFRPFQSNLSILSFGTVYPLDRQTGPPRMPVRGGDFYLKSGDIEVEALVARDETHPSIPFENWRYREAVGGRASIVKPTWGLGLSTWNLYGDNSAVPAVPTSATVPAGREWMWAVDGSTQIYKGLSAYGALAATTFNNNGINYDFKNRAVVGGLFLKGLVNPDGEMRLQYQSVDPNYDALAVRNQVMYTANYRVLTGEARVPWKSGQAYVSVRNYTQLQPDISAGTRSFATADAAFPSSPLNQGRGNIFDVLAGAEWEIPDTPCRIYGSWEQVHFSRGATPGLANSATDRTVGQEMAMLRIDASKQWAVHLGVVHFHAQGYIGSFTRTLLNNEDQVVPRLGVTWTPNRDLSAYLMMQKYGYVDGVAASKGLNNYNASQVILEVQTRVGGEL